MTTRAQASHTYDAIVVGSGISGGWAAKVLTEGGLRTLVLERGRPVEHIKDYPTANLAPWELPHGNRATAQDAADSPIQSKLYLYGQDSKHFLVKDVEHPYNQVKPFQWFRGYHVGGRSLLWARHCFRWSDLDFTANAREGVGIDWPIRYADIAPWYDVVERFIGVSGENAGLPQLPDGQLLPPFEMNCVEAHLKSRLPQVFTDRVLIASRCHVSDFFERRQMAGMLDCSGRRRSFERLPRFLGDEEVARHRDCGNCHHYRLQS